MIAELDPQNAGVLIVRLDGQGRGMDPEEVTRRLERGNRDCVCHHVNFLKMLVM